MIVLGITFDTHDSSASIFVDGKLIAAAEEERFNRVKHTKDFPSESIRFCLKKAGCTINDVAKIALFMNPKYCYRLTFCAMISQIPRSISYYKYGKKWENRRKLLYKRIIDHLGTEVKDRIVFVPHHVAHAYSAVYGSGYQKSLVLTLDGRGEYDTITVYLADNGILNQIHKILYPHSIGYFYSTGTKYLGFKPKYDEYKVMGLASYGMQSDELDLAFRKLYKCKHGSISLDLSYFDHHTGCNNRNLYSPKYITLFGSERNAENWTQKDADFAFALQKHTTNMICSILDYYHSKYPDYNNLCLAGGVALNCAANEMIARKCGFKKIFVQPAANDAGTSLGAAAYVDSQIEQLVKHMPMMNPYLGPSFDNDNFLEFAKEKQLHISKPDDIYAYTARRIHNGDIIGWFQGAMEFGPRALGNRSILASPTDSKTKDRINACIKHRELFRPFAPAIMSDMAKEYFYIDDTATDLYPYMLATVHVKPEMADRIRATVHVDGTSRVQTVFKSINPQFYHLLEAYYKISGVPVLLNTSFNIGKEPIVCSPEDAIRSYILSELDCCIIGDYCIER